jgi:hypothetical protein
MKKYFYKLLVFSLTALVLSSCLWEDEVVDPSTNPSFVSLKFGRNDSVPALQYASFKLVYDSLLNDSVIVNLDSLPYQTSLDTVYPTFTFVSTSGMQLLLRDTLGIGIDTITLDGTDTIDFNRVLSVRNIAQDELTERVYPIKVNVHQVEPQLFHWRRLANDIYSHPGSTQKAIQYKGKYLFYVNSGLNNYLYSSADAANWSLVSVSGLPANAELRGMTIFNNKLFMVHEDGKIYSSDDGLAWTNQLPDAPGHSILNLLFELDSKLWSVMRNNADQAIHFAQSSNGVNWSVKEQVPAGFPVGDYAAFSFKSRTKKPKAIILGGYDQSGNLLNKIWSVENNVYNVYKWVDFSLENTTLGSLAGASLIAYDDKLLLFGGMDREDNIVRNPYMESIDEGLTWRDVDSTYNVITDSALVVDYQPRSYQSVVYDDVDKRLYLFGGRTKTKIFSDVWTGKINRLSFILQ